MPVPQVGAPLGELAEGHHADQLPDGLAVEVWTPPVGDLFVAALEFGQIAGVVSIEERCFPVGVISVYESIGELVCPLGSDRDFDEAECFHQVGPEPLVEQVSGQDNPEPGSRGEQVSVVAWGIGFEALPV